MHGEVIKSIEVVFDLLSFFNSLNLFCPHLNYSICIELVQCVHVILNCMVCNMR